MCRACPNGGEKTFGKDSIMNKKYNSIAMYGYAFSFRDRNNPDLRRIKRYLRASVVYPAVFMLMLPVLGFLYSL